MIVGFRILMPPIHAARETVPVLQSLSVTQASCTGSDQIRVIRLSVLVRAMNTAAARSRRGHRCGLRNARRPSSAR